MVANKPIKIDDLVTGLPEPVFPDMPGENEDIPYTPDVSRMVGGHKVDANVPLKLEAPE